MLPERLIRFFSSLRLTVVCLTVGMVLVLAGTFAQVEMGLYKAQNEFFRSFFIYWSPGDTGWRIPVFPGGYLVGGVLLINLIAAHFTRFRFSRNKAGIWLIHLGLILLLLGQLLTDVLSSESSLHLREGETRNYSTSDREAELAVIDSSDSQLDKVVAIPQGVLMHRDQIRHKELPFTILVKHFYPNSIVENRATNSAAPPAATQGVGPFATLKELPKITAMDRRDVPSAVLELVGPEGSLGTWLVSEYLEQLQPVTVKNQTYQLVLRPRRHYKAFSVQLLDFRHDVYPGTQIPKNFSSRVRVMNPSKGENREVLIKMNNPLRYSGETFYQASFDVDNKGSILQVVRNPSWLAPYFACILVGIGLLVQFAIQLFGFTFTRRTA
jgi:hypothetical protein